MTGDLSSARRQRARAGGVVYVGEGRCVFTALDVAENLKLGAIALGFTAPPDDYERSYRLFPVLAPRRASWPAR